MAGEKCSITCNVRDRQGRVKVSALWKELEKFYKGDRRQAIVHYFLTKDSKFLTENSDVLEFDVDGEVTIASLKKALERSGNYDDLSNAKVLEALNKEIEDELKGRDRQGNKVDYSEALNAVLNFNRSSQFKDGFMATLSKQDDGRFSVKVIERTPLKEEELADQVSNKIVTDSLRVLLKEKGLSVDFLDNPRYAVKYSSNNVQPVDNLYSLIKVLNGDHTAPEVAEGAGHFAVAAMAGNPLIERLVAQMTPEVQEALFKAPNAELANEDFVVSDSDESRREAAGILIGRALLDPLRKAQLGVPAKLAAFTVKAIKNWGGIKYLLSKVKDAIKRIFGKIPEESINTIIQRAKESAATAAQGFISDPTAADRETALAEENQRTVVNRGYSSKYLSREIKKNVQAYRDSLNSLKDVVAHLRVLAGSAENPTNRDIYKKLRNLSTSISSQYDLNMSVEAFADRSSIEGMVVMLEAISQVLDTDVRTLLDSVQPADKATFRANIVSNAKSIRTAATTIKGIAQLYDTLSSKFGDLEKAKVSEAIQYQDADANQVVETLEEALFKLGQVLVGTPETYENQQGTEQRVFGLVNLLELKRRQVFTDALTDFYGKDYIERNAGVIWIQKGGKRKLVRSDKIEGYNHKAVADLINSLEEDISNLDAYLSSAADSGDFVTAVGDKVVKQANMEADRVAMRFWDRIETLRLQMKDLFRSADWAPLLETIDTLDENGRVIGKQKTGNFISRVNYGAWEAERTKFAKELKERFNEHLIEVRKEFYKNNRTRPEELFNPTDEQLAVLYHNFVDEKWEQWHNENSDKEGGIQGIRYVPKADKYHNKQWDEMFDTEVPGLSSAEKKLRGKRLTWFNTFMELKDDMDSLLPPNATIRWRAPQITGRFSHKYRNLKSQYQNSPEAFGRAMRMSSQMWLQIKPEEAWMFGSNNEFNEIEEDPLENDIFFEKEKVKRLPLYGINKLHDMNMLSTDIFGTMLSYGSMAATYNALSRTADVFEIGRDVLQERDKSYMGKKNKENHSKTVTRYIKWLEKNVYGVNVTKPSFDSKGVWMKVINGLSSIGGRILLWGNIHGGIVNQGTGFFEIFKEATAGENFNLKELAQAHKMYFTGIIDTMVQEMADLQRPDDKNALWIRHWNILSENRAFLHHQRFDNRAMSLLDNRLWDWVGHTMMLPYSSGDHYMQTIPYYAMGIHEKVYDEHGRKINLIDAYEIVDGQEVFAIERERGEKPLGETPKKIQLKQRIFRTPQDMREFRVVQTMQNKIADFFDNHPDARGTSPFDPQMFSSSDVEFLENEGLRIPQTVKQLESLKIALANKAANLQYNGTDESAFMDKCRNICNRLHGIYNSEDKVTFQQSFYGNLVMALRGYALGMANRRFADSRFNIPQNKQVEGSFNTLSKVMLSGFYNLYNMDNWKAVGEALLLTIPVGQYTMFNKKFSSKVEADMIRAGYSPHQYYNIRRAGADFMVIQSLMLLNWLSSPANHFGLRGDGDKENPKEKWWLDLLYYFTMRWINEQTAFNTVGGMTKEAMTLLDYIPAGLSGFTTMLDVMKLALLTGIDQIGGPDKTNTNLYYGQSKKGSYEKGDAKLKVKFKHLAPFIRSYYAFQHPLVTAQSYEYGRKVRGK